MHYDQRRWRIVLRPPKRITVREQMLIAGLPMATLEYHLGQCLDKRILKIALFNFRIADIKILRSPTWKRAEIEVTIRIIITLSSLKLSNKENYILLLFIICSPIIIIIQIEILLRNLLPDVSLSNVTL
jgi:hypothetical protein